MKKKVLRSKSDIRFSIEIYRFPDIKEIKINNMPFNRIDEVIKELKEKYG